MSLRIPCQRICRKAITSNTAACRPVRFPTEYPKRMSRALLSQIGEWWLTILSAPPTEMSMLASGANGSDVGSGWGPTCEGWVERGAGSRTTFLTFRDLFSPARAAYSSIRVYNHTGRSFPCNSVPSRIEAGLSALPGCLRLEPRGQPPCTRRHRRTTWPRERDRQPDREVAPTLQVEPAGVQALHPPR
jgi:hypothetical protein